jgi:hypothetical protein
MPLGVVVAMAACSCRIAPWVQQWLRSAQVDDNVNVDSIVQSDFLPGHGMPR